MIIRREIRKRGFFGWLFLLLFLGFNALCAVWLWAGVAATSQMTAVSQAERVGHAVGTAMGVGMILVFWTMGAVITGLLAMLTRGRKTIIEEIG